jgi:hypothetical protein
LLLSKGLRKGSCKSSVKFVRVMENHRKTISGTKNHGPQFMAARNSRTRICFVEPEAFTAEVLRVAGEETLRQFEAELAAHPEAGDLIRHSGGLRKARMKLPGRGKSGAARVIWLWLPAAPAFRVVHALHEGKAGGQPTRTGAG